ncbi:LPXTG cell wall anchor domain-containing protein, partial [Streptomyces sp. rh34]|uniref:LPXTG cell wall anchor domain-containing protein n=1 Tax=Streptomyces sp. rh34 TaxID=2034272 RepID=UPI00211D5EA4
DQGGGDQGGGDQGGGDQGGGDQGGGDQGGGDQGGGDQGGGDQGGGDQGGGDQGGTGTSGSASAGSTGGATTGGGDAGTCTVDLDGAECTDNTDTDSVGNKPVEQSKGKEELAETGAAETTFLVIGAATMIAGGIGFRILPRLVGGGRAVA